MVHRSSTFVLAAALILSITGAQAFDETRYPNWRGQWLQVGGDRDSPWDPTRPAGAGQQAPLTPEYQAIFEASIRAEAEGGMPRDPAARCVPVGVPRVMMATWPMEIVITPNITYFMFEQFSMLRQVYTDGRKFPDDIDPSFAGYSIGEWQDASGSGRFDTLTFETRGLKGPHTYDSSGIPFHRDGEAVVREKLYADNADPNVLHDEITVTDSALTKPWTVIRSYRRSASPAQAKWSEFLCSEDRSRVQIGDQVYKLSPEGLLMPVRRGQKPPDLKYFK
jgi:hypothetical protein